MSEKERAMTTYTPTPEAVEAAARAAGMYGRVAQDGLTPEQQFEQDWQDEEYREQARAEARAALTAAGPLIERAAADRAAEDITAAMNEPALINLADRYGGYYQGQRSGLERAASIARGEGS